MIGTQPRLQHLMAWAIHSHAVRYSIAWSGNTFINQNLGGITRFLLSKYTPGNNFIIS